MDQLSKIILSMDTDALFHMSLSEEKQGKLEITHTSGPHVIYGILFQILSTILPRKRLNSLKINQIKLQPFIQMYHIVVSTGTHKIEMGANLTHYLTTIERYISPNIDKMNVQLGILPNFILFSMMWTLRWHL